jgi:hypothetical protein
LSGYLISKILFFALLALICSVGYLTIKTLPQNHPLRAKLLNLSTPYAIKMAKISVFIIAFGYFLGALILYG